MHDRSALIADILQAQQTMNRAIGASSRQLWVELDLSMAQLKTLMTLYDSGPLSIGQIAEALGIGQPTASHLVERLVQSGFVGRTEDPVDRRRTLAELSSRGNTLIEQLREVRSEQLHRWLMQLDDPTLAALRLGLQALIDAARADVPSIATAP